ncbi:MAG TPA: hypothetical protein VNW97_21150 [Candidatus Saccharimonadales bacterium]|jgi:hypothetical protein|nr:hypothetical protein [Candidatus Saccharimonadales bacterium]
MKLPPSQRDANWPENVKVRQKISAKNTDLPSVDLKEANAYGQDSVNSGETLKLRVSSEGKYSIQIRNASSNEVLVGPQANPDPNNQPIYPGSFALIENHLNPDEIISNLTLECWVRPFDPTVRSQG